MKPQNISFSRGFRGYVSRFQVVCKLKLLWMIHTQLQSTIATEDQEFESLGCNMMQYFIR